MSQNKSTARTAIVHNTELDIFEEFNMDSNNFLAERFHNKLKAETQWFEKVITHPVAIGTFYENLLRSTLREFAPSNNNIATGFVYDAESSEHGKQIDILIYDSTDRNVLYKNDEFVVVYPGSVISVTEVKKTINKRNLSDVINTTFFNSLGSHSKDVYGVQYLRIFGYKLEGTIENLLDAVLKSIERCIEETHLEQGKLLCQNIVIPSVYFLDEPYFIETRLLYDSKMKYNIEVSLHKTAEFGSLGTYLSQVIKQNHKKMTRYESNYLSRNIRKLPIQKTSTTNPILLYKKIPFADIVKHYKLTKEAISKCSGGTKKPLQIFIPITMSLEDFDSFSKLCSFEGNMVVMTQGSDDTELKSASELLTNSA